MKDIQEGQLEQAHLLYKEWQLCWQPLKQLTFIDVANYATRLSS